MSATFNWAYRPGVTNKYGVTIPAGADNVRPSGYVYVALFGNDNNGNGSRQLPFRTLTKAISLQVDTIIIGSGTYREGDFSSSQGISKIFGDGDVIIDLTLRAMFFGSNRGGDVSYYNLYFRGKGASMIASTTGNCKVLDCTFDGVYPGLQWSVGTGWTAMSNCIFINSSLTITGSTMASIYTNLTFYKCNVYFQNPSFGIYGSALSMVFHSCNVHFAALPICTDFNLFYECNFRLVTSVPTVPITFYPNVPTGFNYYSTLSDFLTACATAFGSSSVFAKSVFSDPLFNNISISDFTLTFNSPAKNLSYFGTCVGARSIAQGIKVRATEASGNFDFSSIVNLAVADDSITFIDSTIDGQIDSNCLVNILERSLASIPSYGINADRNGQYIDSIADLNTATKAAGDTLSVPVPYIVEVGAITYNGIIYEPGDRFTTLTGITTFSTTSSGLLREILEAPERHTVMMRVGNGGISVSAGTTLTTGYWYYIETGSVTYNSVMYAAGSTFKALDTSAFSGSGSVIEALTTEAFQHYEPGIQPTSNNTGDAPTGAILRGNGDPAYIRGGLGVNEFAINQKFIQIRFYIRANNLKP